MTKKVPDRPSRFSSIPLALLTIALVFGATLYFGEIILRRTGWIEERQLTHEEKAQPVQIQVAAARFSIAPELIRHAEQRKGGLLPQLDLAVLWPTMEPSPREAAGNDAILAKRILITIEQSTGSLDTSSRFESIYRKFFIGTPEPIVGNLHEQKLDPESGYGDETIVYDPRGGQPFAARCTRPTADIPTECLREIILPNGLTVIYRFRRPLLAHWRDLDDKLLSFLIRLTAR